MRKALAGVVIVAFTGLLCTSLLAMFHGTTIGSEYLTSQALQYPFFMAY